MDIKPDNELDECLKYTRPQEIPISYAEGTAKRFGYNQIVIIARNTHHIRIHRTTWGATKTLCKDAAWAAEIFELLMVSSSAEDFIKSVNQHQKFRKKENGL